MNDSIIDFPSRMNPSIPLDGDVIVTPASEDGQYAVCQFPGVLQFKASTRDEAVQRARGFARTMAVDVWYTENGSNSLLERYRVGGSRGQTERRQGH